MGLKGALGNPDVCSKTCSTVITSFPFVANSGMISATRRETSSTPAPMRIHTAAAIALGVPVLFASSASGTIIGPCTASGTINGVTYNASQPSVVIPRKGDVNWTGAIQNASGTRNIEGKVYLKLPPPFGKIVVA